MASKAWADVVFPPRGTWDSLVLALNLVPLALSATVRAAFWSLRLPLFVLDGWTQMHWRSVAWLASDGGAGRLEDNGGGDSSAQAPVETLVQAAIQRGAHRFPHSHGRPFPRHLAGIAALTQNWQQPEGLCRAALLHSAYSTEMFPWGLYAFAERAVVRDLIGEAAEAVVFLYCTVSQSGLYTEALRLTALREGIPAEGLAVRNCQTGEALRVPPRAAARVLVLLGADVAEQDPFFDLHLVASLVFLAAPHLDSPPPLAAELGRAGFFDLSRAEHAALCRHARSLLAKGRAADPGALEAAARKAPWLYELGVEACRQGRGGAGGDLGRACLRWCEAWGTPWSRVVQPREEIERVRAVVGAGGA